MHPIILTECNFNRIQMKSSEMCGLQLIDTLMDCGAAVVLEPCNDVIILWIEVVCGLQ